MTAANGNERRLRNGTDGMTEPASPKTHGAMIVSEAMKVIFPRGSSSRRYRHVAPITASFLVLCCMLAVLRSPSDHYTSHVVIYQHKRFFRKTEEVDSVTAALLNTKATDDHEPENLSRKSQFTKGRPSPTMAMSAPEDRSLEDAAIEGRDIEVAVRVFAFYHSIDGSGLIPEGDSRLIEDWKSAWASQGYSPQVLTMTDAQKHPDFDEYAGAIDYLLSSGGRRRKQELRDCYLRYLAIAAVQGGIMVDLDTRPSHAALLSQQTPPDKFTLYCGMVTGDPGDWLLQVEPQNGLPCSVHASATEWTRVAKLLGWASKQFDNLKDWTDMHSLLYLARFGEIDVVEEKHVDSWRTNSWNICYFRHV